MADGCFLILCGIPASGKSTFAQELMRMKWEILGKLVHFVYVSYDDFIPENLPPSETSFLASWKAKRREILNGVKELILFGDDDERMLTAGEEKRFDKREQFVSNPCPCSADHATRTNDFYHVVIVDDNMYYRSMRYEYYQLARVVSYSFAEVYLYCPLDLALSRNTTRHEAVMENTIVRMIDRIERPDPEKFSWEKFSIMLDTSTSVTHETWVDILELLQSAACEVPPPQNISNEEEKAKDRAITQRNIIHQADQVIRKRISAELARMKESVSHEDLKQMAWSLNQRRKKVMEQIKNDPLIITKVLFLEQAKISCEIGASRTGTFPSSGTSSCHHYELKSREEVDENPDAPSGCVAGICSSVEVVNKQGHRCELDGNFVSTAVKLESPLTLGNLWEVVTLDDFSNIVKILFNQCH